MPSWVRAVVACACFAAGCGDDDGGGGAITRGDGMWTCPAGWARDDRGGCAPSADPSGWIEPGAPGGPPAETYLPPGGKGTGAGDWAPIAGIPDCAGGWTRLPDGTCDPMLAACSGSAPIPGAGCVPVRDEDCPATEWPDVAPEAGSARILHVRAGASAPPDGTRASPFPTIGAALTAAGAGEWIVVAAGTYDERVTLTRDTHLVGVCAARVAVRGEGPGSATVSVEGGAADIRGLTLGGSAAGLLVTGGSASLREMVIADQTQAAVISSGGAVALESSLVTRSGSSTDGATLVVRTAAGSGLTVRRSALVDNTPFGAATPPDDPATLRLESVGTLEVEGSYVRGTSASLVVIRGTATVSGSVLEDESPLAIAALREGTLRLDQSVVRSLRNDGNALAAYGGASVDISGSLLERTSGLQVNEPGTDLVVTESVVRGRAGGSLLYGIVATGTARASAVRTRIVGATRNAAYAVDEGTVLELDASEIHGAPAAPVGELFGPCVVATGRSSVRVVGSLLAECSRIGLLSTNLSTLVLEDSVVRGTYADAEDAPATPADESTLGHGLQVTCSARAEVRGTVFSDNEGAGVLAASLPAADPGCLVADATAVLEDTVVGDTRPHTEGTSAGHGGYGLQAHSAGRIEATRVLVARSTDAGVFVLDRESSVELDTAAVIDTRPRPDGAAGRGLLATTGGRVVATRTIVRGSGEAGAMAIAASLTLRDSTVTGVAPRTDGAYGVGIAVGLGSGARATLERVLVERVQEAGLLFVGATAELDDVVVRDVAASPRGFGIGLGAAGGAQVTVTRLAIARVAGAGIASTPFELAEPPAPLPPIPRTAGTRISGEDVLVEDVRSSTVAFEVAGGVIRPIGTRVAYGLAVSPDCAIELTRAAVHEGGFGFHDAGGALTLVDAAVTGQLDALGARSGAADVALERLFTNGNARDEIVEDPGLPETATLPPPTDLEI